MVQPDPVAALCHYFGRLGNLDAGARQQMLELDFPGGWDPVAQVDGDEAVVTLTSPAGLGTNRIQIRHRVFRRPGRGWIYADPIDLEPVIIETGSG